MRFPAIRAVVFDFDGTLFDASDAICHAFNAARVAHGHAPLSRADILPRIGRPLAEIFQTLSPGAPAATVQAHVDAYRAAFWPISLSHTRTLPGLRECLDRLRGRVGLAIATNRSERGARFILEGFGCGGYFDVIVAVEHVRRAKPDPEAVQLACARLAVAPADALMVGDTPDDVAAGRAAGAATVGLTTGAHDRAGLAAAGADVVAASLAELPALLGLA